MAGLIGDREVERFAKHPPLALASDEGALEPSRPSLTTGEREQPERLDRLLLPLQLQRLDGLDLDRVAHELDGLGAEQHLARREPPARAAPRR